NGDVSDTGTIRTRTPVLAPPGAKERLTRAYYTDPGRSPVANGGDDSDFDHAFDFTDLDHGSRHRIGTLTGESFLVDHPVEAYAPPMQQDTSQPSPVTATNATTSSLPPQGPTSSSARPRSRRTETPPAGST